MSEALPPTVSWQYIFVQKSLRENYDFAAKINEFAAIFLQLIFNNFAAVFLTNLRLKVNKFAAIFGYIFYDFASNLCTISRLICVRFSG